MADQYAVSLSAHLGRMLKLPSMLRVMPEVERPVIDCHLAIVICHNLAM